MEETFIGKEIFINGERIAYVVDNSASFEIDVEKDTIKVEGLRFFPYGKQKLISFIFSLTN